jgi:hypothetical protein
VDGVLWSRRVDASWNSCNFRTGYYAGQEQAFPDCSQVELSIRTRKYVFGVESSCLELSAALDGRSAALISVFRGSQCY